MHTAQQIAGEIAPYLMGALVLGYVVGGVFGYMLGRLDGAQDERVKHTRERFKKRVNKDR